MRRRAAAPSPAIWARSPRYSPRWEEAEQHFHDALAMNTRMGARPWLAHTQYDYATMLLARNQPGDREKAQELLDLALTTAHELGTLRLEEKVKSQSAKVKSQKDLPPSP